MFCSVALSIKESVQSMGAYYVYEATKQFSDKAQAWDLLLITGKMRTLMEIVPTRDSPYPQGYVWATRLRYSPLPPGGQVRTVTPYYS